MQSLAHAAAVAAVGSPTSGDLGQLGTGDRCNSWLPVPIDALDGVGVVQISLGTAHSAALSSDGRVLTWGHGNGGRLGHGDEDDKLVPVVVAALEDQDVVQVLCVRLCLYACVGARVFVHLASLHLSSCILNIEY